MPIVFQLLQKEQLKTLEVCCPVLSVSRVLVDLSSVVSCGSACVVFVRVSARTCLFVFVFVCVCKVRGAVWKLFCVGVTATATGHKLPRVHLLKGAELSDVAQGCGLNEWRGVWSDKDNDNDNTQRRCVQQLLDIWLCGHERWGHNPTKKTLEIWMFVGSNRSHKALREASTPRSL